MKNITIIALLFTLIYACHDPYEDQITPAYEFYPAATYMSMDSSLSIWVELLRYTDLFNTLNLNANYTCFIPNNEAMQTFLTIKGYASVTDIPINEALYLVKYHTIPEAEYSQSLFDNGVLADTTASGDFLSIEIREGGLNAIFVNGEARIEKLDQDVTNGIIHIIGNVLTPVTETIWQKLDAPEYTIFKEAVNATSYAERLNTITKTELNTTTGVTSIRKKYFTLFAITNNRFEEFGITSVPELEKYLMEKSEDSLSGTDELVRYIGYHILEQMVDYDELATFSNSSTSKNLVTAAPNELINVSVINGFLYLNPDTATGTYTTIVEENIRCKNGVMHNVSAPLTVITPPKTTVIWELTDYPDMASLFSNVYRKSTVSSTTSYYIAPGEVTCYDWDAIPSSNNDNSVAYLIANKNDAVKFEMVNHDCLYLDLGLYGWIDIVSPSIIKGNYKVSVQFHSLAAPTEYGKFLLILDGDYFGSEVSTHGRSSTKTQNVKVEIGEATFDETTTHTFRILAGDDVGFYIDYIEFKPVN